MARRKSCAGLSGLGSRYWGEVIEVLRSIIPVYDRVNRVISFGKDEEYRLRGIRGRVMPHNIVLDAGSGYGNMSRVALAEAGDDVQIVMYDPIPEMLANVKNYFPEGNASLLPSSGIFEFMPFRDAIQLKQAIAEMHRVLKAGGRLIIVDLGKPDGSLAKTMVSFYLKYFLGVFAYLAAGRAGLKFRMLYGTYLRWPRNSELDAMLKEKFSRVQFDKRMMGGAVIIAAYK